MILRILKIKPWMIKFKIDDQIYFIKDCDETYEHFKTLYKYIPTDNKGHYKTEVLKHSAGNLNTNDFVTYKRGRTYKDADLRKFWSALAWYNFGEIVGMSAENISAFKRERQKIMCEEKIEKLEKELASERLRLFILEHPEDYKLEW